MSLLVFNSSNRIAQGVIKRLYGSGNFEKIVCADLYPNYYSIQRFLNFKKELTEASSNTKITDIKANEKSELSNAIQSCTHLLYITHDYYSLTASKLSLIQTTAELAKKNKNLKKFIALTPSEHDHYGEPNPVHAARRSEQEATNIYPNLTLLNTDLTFGPHSTFSHSLLTRFVNGRGLTGLIPSVVQNVHPIHTDDVAAIVETVFNENGHEGRAYLLRGSETISLHDYINILKEHVRSTEISDRSFLEKIISPASSNYLAQKLYDPSYINLVRLLTHYKSIEKEGFENIEKFKLPLKGIRTSHLEERINEADYKNEEGTLERIKKNHIY